MAGSQCTNTTQMQIQTCTFVLYRQLSCTLGLSQREGKGKMHEQLAIIALLSQDDEHIHVIVLTYIGPLSAIRLVKTSA
jgi:hypothetical protein